MLRRVASRDRRSKPVFHSQDLTINFAGHIATMSGQELNLTAAEYKLLSYMALNANRVVMPDQILENVWGGDFLEILICFRCIFPGSGVN